MNKNTKSKLLSSVFDAPNTFAALTKQYNNLARLTGKSHFIAQKLESLLIISDSELLTNAFSLITKGMNPNIVISKIDSSSFSLDTPIAHDIIILIAHDADTVSRVTKLLGAIKSNTSKIFLLAPSLLKFSSLSNIGIDIAVSLESSANDIRDAILRGIEGEKFTLGFSCIIEETFPHLTPRQKDVLKLICNGKSNKEIARDLNIALSTIKVHCAAIFKELGVTNRTQAALILGG